MTSRGSVSSGARWCPGTTRFSKGHHWYHTNRATVAPPLMRVDGLRGFGHHSIWNATGATGECFPPCHFPAKNHWILGGFGIWTEKKQIENKNKWKEKSNKGSLVWQSGWLTTTPRILKSYVIISKFNFGNTPKLYKC